MKNWIVVVAMAVSVVMLGGIVGLGLVKPNETPEPAEATVHELKEEYYEGFPLIEIETQDGQLPFDKETYINCSFKLSNAGEYNLEVEMKEEYGDEDSVGIRLRGNSTMAADKKPYRIKFDSKTSLFGLKKNKSWVLLADYYDMSNIKNYTAMSLASKFDNLDFTPTPHHVVVSINGDYKGLYLLCEQIDEKEGRTNVEADFDPSVDTSFPFLIEMDQHALNEGVTGVDNFKIEGFQPIEIKYPEADERGIEEGQQDVVFDYIKEYMNAVLTTLSTGDAVMFRGASVHFEDLVDVESFIDYFLVNEITVNSDSNKKSIYMHKTKDGKLKMGPIWDFDLCMSNYGVESTESSINMANSLHSLRRSPLMKNFLQKESNYQLVQQRWDEVKDYIYEVNTELKDYKAKLKVVAKYDALRWYGENGFTVFDFQYDYVRLFLLDRYDFLDKVLDKPYNEFKEYM